VVPGKAFPLDVAIEHCAWRVSFRGVASQGETIETIVVAVGPKYDVLFALILVNDGVVQLVPSVSWEKLLRHVAVYAHHAQLLSDLSGGLVYTKASC